MCYREQGALSDYRPRSTCSGRVAALTLTVSQRGCGLWLIPPTPCLVATPLTCVLSWGSWVVLWKASTPQDCEFLFSRRKGHGLSPKRITTILYHSAQWLLLAMSSPHLKISLCQAAHSAPSTHRLTKSSQRLSKLSAIVRFILERIVEVQGRPGQHRSRWPHVAFEHLRYAVSVTIYTHDFKDLVQRAKSKKACKIAYKYIFNTSYLLKC